MGFFTFYYTIKNLKQYAVPLHLFSKVKKEKAKKEGFVNVHLKTTKLFSAAKVEKL